MGVVLPAVFAYATCFSALQRAENSSIRRHVPGVVAGCARFQCSSASRKFLNQALVAQILSLVGDVSVLFSEPKIPQ